MLEIVTIIVGREPMDNTPTSLSESNTVSEEHVFTESSGPDERILPVSLQQLRVHTCYENLNSPAEKAN